MREHREWTTKLSEYLADEMKAPERAALEAHLAACGPCRAALADLQRIVAEAGALPDVEPPRDLWHGIAAAIDAGPEAAPAVLPFPIEARRTPARRIELSPAKLAAAAVVLVALSSSVSWWMGSTRGGAALVSPDLGSGPVMGAAVGAEPGAPVALTEEVAALEEILVAARDVLDPNTVRVIESSLGVIEQAIADSREALAQDPGNAFLAEHLERMYRRKLVYLRDALRLAELEV